MMSNRMIGRAADWYEVMGSKTTSNSVRYMLTSVPDSLQVFGLWAILILRLHALYEKRLLTISMIVLSAFAGVAMLTIVTFTGIITPCECLAEWRK